MAITRASEIGDQMEQPTQQTDPALACLPLPDGFLDASLAEWLSAIGTVGATVVALALALGNLWARNKERKEAEAETLRERARVYCWAIPTVPVQEHGGKAWIQNDTDLPIHYLSYNISTDAVGGKQGLNTAGSLLLPPRQTRVIDIDPNDFKTVDVTNPKIHIMVHFTDVEGYLWTRHSNGSLTTGNFIEAQMPTPLTEGRPAPL